MSTLCTYYMRGSCRFGARCWNSHDLSPPRPDDTFAFQSSDDESVEAIQSSFLRQLRLPAKQNPEQNNPPETQSVPKSPIWSLTNKDSRETREGTPDTVLLETVKKLNDAENEVNSLKQQLHSMNDGENGFSYLAHQLEKTLDSDLQCNICYELFIKPTVLNCSHTFCLDCIESWTRRVNHCPTCRVYVKSKSHCLTLDIFIDKIVSFLPDDASSKRQALVLERNNNRVTNNRNRRNNNRRRNNRNQSMRRTIDMIWGDRDRDGADWNIALEEALFDPTRLGDVLGRNRNDRDEWEDTLSDSSIDSLDYEFCYNCDSIGHSAFNCPLVIMEEDDHLGIHRI